MNVLRKRVHQMNCDPDNDLYSNIDCDTDNFALCKLGIRQNIYYYLSWLFYVHK